MNDVIIRENKSPFLYFVIGFICASIISLVVFTIAVKANLFGGTFEYSAGPIIIDEPTDMSVDAVPTNVEKDIPSTIAAEPKLKSSAPSNWIKKSLVINDQVADKVFNVELVIPPDAKIEVDENDYWRTISNNLFKLDFHTSTINSSFSYNSPVLIGTNVNSSDKIYRYSFPEMQNVYTSNLLLISPCKGTKEQPDDLDAPCGSAYIQEDSNDIYSPAMAFICTDGDLEICDQIVLNMNFVTEK